VTLSPRKLLVAAVATAALGACSTTTRAPAARAIAVPAPVSNAAVAPAPAPAPEAPPEVIPVLASEAETPAAQPLTDEHDRPLCGNVRTKRSTADCRQ
jgi:hypothetical protein